MDVFVATIQEHPLLICSAIARTVAEEFARTNHLAALKQLLLLLLLRLLHQNLQVRMHEGRRRVHLRHAVGHRYRELGPGIKDRVWIALLSHEQAVLVVLLLQHALDELASCFNLTDSFSSESRSHAWEPMKLV